MRGLLAVVYRLEYDKDDNEANINVTIAGIGNGTYDSLLISLIKPKCRSLFKIRYRRHALHAKHSQKWLYRNR